METKLLFCSRCVMDGSSEELVLDSNGVCNFCHQAEKALKEIELEKPNLPRIIEQIKRDGKGNKYDCLIGLSGGVDSSTTLHQAIKLGLRPLCFSVDNGWNDPRADENILKIIEKLKVPFYRYTIDLDKFKDLQSAFLMAGVPNIEIPTDHILMAVSYEMADKYSIKWILSGGNVATESIMPSSWGYNARDLVHIKDIYKQMKGKNLNGLPLCGVWKWNYYRWIAGIKILYPLDYLSYHREESIKFLENEYGYQDYGEKHCESTWTWWFQNFYLYQKFGIDKRKAHYASLINSGQMTRREAMKLLLESPVYPRLGIEDKVMKYPKRRHENFKMDKWYPRIAKLVKIIKNIW
jgi:N-acetyl sugar amidotransferase